MNKKLIYVLFIILAFSSFFVSTLYSQSLFVKTFGGASSDLLTSMQLTSDGGSILTGYTILSSFGDNDIYVLKLNEKGNITWAKNYGGPSNDQSSSIIQTSDGGFIIAGQTKSFGASGYDIYLLKLGSDGAITWSKSFKAANDEFATGIIQTEDGGYIVSGYSNSFSATGSDFDILILKLASDGTLVWGKTYGGAVNDFSTSIKKTLSGFVISGYTYSFDAQMGDALIINMSSSGTVLWSRMYGGMAEDRANSIDITGNDFIIAGQTQSFDLQNEDVFVFKLDNNGYIYDNDNAKPRTFGSSFKLSDKANSIILTTDGGYALTGYVNSVGNDKDIVIIKLFGNLEFNWAKLYGGSNNESGNFIIQRKGNYFIGGNTNSFGSGSDDACFMSVKEDGTSCMDEISLIPLGGNPTVTETPVELNILDVSSQILQNNPASLNEISKFSVVTKCETP